MELQFWAPYSNFSFSKWDKSAIESTHTQFLERLMRCDVYLPNLMMRRELGWRTLLTDIIRRSVLYIKHLELNNGSMTNIALDSEASLNDDANILSPVRSFASYFNETHHYLSPRNKDGVEK